MRALALILLLLHPFAAMAQDNPILRRMTEIVAAYNRQDVAALAEAYAPDAVLLVPLQQAIVGRDAIAAHYRGLFETATPVLQAKTFDIRPLGEKAAIEVGETVVDVNGQRVVGRYMHMWEVIDGQLLVTRHMHQLLKAD